MLIDIVLPGFERECGLTTFQQQSSVQEFGHQFIVAINAFQKMILNKMMIASKHHITIHNPYQAHYCEIGLFCLAIIFLGGKCVRGTLPPVITNLNLPIKLDLVGRWRMKMRSTAMRRGELFLFFGGLKMLGSRSRPQTLRHEVEVGHWKN